MTEDQIIAQELARLTNANNKQETSNVNEFDVYQKLAAPFPMEAYSVDSSRGFDLTSLKTQYIIERLNEVIGIMNWTFGGEFQEKENGVVYFGALILNINGKTQKQFAPGYSANKKNLGDTYKGAQTDSLSKCASRFGIGNEMFKGLINPDKVKDFKSGNVKIADASDTQSKSNFKRKSTTNGF